MSGEARSRGGVEIPRSEPKTLQSLNGPIRYLNHVLYDATKRLAAGAIDDEIFLQKKGWFSPGKEAYHHPSSYPARPSDGRQSGRQLSIDSL